MQNNRTAALIGKWRNSCFRKSPAKLTSLRLHADSSYFIYLLNYTKVTLSCTVKNSNIKEIR